MKIPLALVLTGWGLLASWIWWRDLAWWSQANEVWPILTGLLIYYYLGRPWIKRPVRAGLSHRWLVLWILILMLGGIFSLTGLLALAATGLLGSSMQAYFEPLARDGGRPRLLWFVFLAFPWMALDGQFIGWCWRLSGSWMAGQAFAATGMAVRQEGTLFWVEGQPLQVDAACAGMNVLQAMLLFGGIHAYQHVRGVGRWWLALVVLVGLSWVANLLRILLLSVVGLTWGHEAAAGWFHEWGGMAALALMFLLTWRIFCWRWWRGEQP